MYVLSTDMGQFDATKGKQALEIRSSLSERRALTDPILPGDSADLAHAHSHQWAKAHGEFRTRDAKHTFFCTLGSPLLAYCSSAVQAELKVRKVQKFTADTCKMFSYCNMKTRCIWDQMNVILNSFLQSFLRVCVSTLTAGLRSSWASLRSSPMSS